MALAVAMIGLWLGASALPVAANAVLDFTGGYGGAITLYADGSLSGVDIPIGLLTVSGAPLSNGGWAVTGGVLSFATGGLAGASSITITGVVSGLAIAWETLLSGTITSFAGTLTSNGLISATGIDTKSPTLLAALGLPSDSTFDLFGVSVALGTLTSDSTAPAIASAMKNVQVPDASSLLLLAVSLAGVVLMARRLGEV